MTPTPEEVCRVLEIMSLHMLTDREDDKLINFVYMMTHIANDRCNNKHEDWVAKFREHQIFWENENKAPIDPTKVTLPCPAF